MAHYDDWVYERGLENEDWVHDRWGDDDDDWDDDFEIEEELDEGEEIMENNRISFAKEYTELEKIVIKTKLNRILNKLKKMEIGASAFKLNNEVIFVYNPGKLLFNTKDGESASYDGHWYSGEYSHSILFLNKWEEIENELREEKNMFKEKEKEILNITFTREDGVSTICNAIKNGADIVIPAIFDLEDLTQAEKKEFIQFGYGYDLYNNEEKDNAEVSEINECISRYIWKGKINEWIKDNPEKCLLTKNRQKVNVEMFS